MIPAQQTRTSTLPKASTAPWMSFSTDSRSVTSAAIPFALPCSAAIFSAVSAVVFGSMSETTTAAPSLASRAAVAAPMPRPLPVMTATLPSYLLTLRLLEMGQRQLVAHPLEHDLDRHADSRHRDV